MKDKMHILFVSQYFYPEVFKGNDIVFDFVKKGHQVTVLTGKPNYPKGKFFEGYSFFNKKEEIIYGAKIIRTPIFPRGNGRGLSIILNYLSFVFFSYFTCLFRIREKYDLIFVQQLSPVTMALPGLWIKRRQKIPLYLWVLDLWPESLVANSNFKSGVIIGIIEKLVKKIYNASDIILISSKYFRKAILDRCDDKNKKIVYFPNWAEDVFTNPKKATAQIPQMPKGFNIVFAGNVGDSQDFESVLKAAELTRNLPINWLIIGDGRALSWIRSEIETKKLDRIYVLGAFPLETMPIFFSKADAMLVSLKDIPIFALTVPAKVQAYLASGKVILGMLNGEGNILINESKTGIAVNSGDYRALAEASTKLVNLEPSKIRIMEENSINYYNEHFAKEKLFNQLESLFLT
ncbi:glycosyltransferase family 4 protein [Pedobacter helvus]|uniref:Glycosyltransferase family 4 protein n=1 Tax=Pedobacter helvus TaxID=2563444 RepID=A0ABW9JDL0_9SPHI|nr:glycosyltransferase family 4 protein [Pedobacter ureilyticus]